MNSERNRNNVYILYLGYIIYVIWSGVMHQGIKSQSLTLKLGNLYGFIKLCSGFLVRAFVRKFDFCIEDYAVAGACSLSSDVC